ncbi:MAG: hypothetical protein WAN10_18975 [Candidatus Acidiferrales bacterium]
MLQAARLFFLGALSFWGPEVILYAWEREELNWGIVTVTLPLCLIAAYAAIRIKRRAKVGVPSAAAFMLLGIWVLGPLAMITGATFLGSGLAHSPIHTALIALLLGFFPPYTFISATYDGSLFALIIASLLMVILHLALERKNWIVPRSWTVHGGPARG